MLRKIILLQTILFLVSMHVSAQVIRLDAPLLAGKQANLYYFQGARVDSIITTIDASGKADFTIEYKNYKGMAALVIPDAGGIEMVVAEPNILVECNSPALNNETAVFPKSEENNFLKYIFTTQTRYLQQQAWLRAGSQLFDEDSQILSAVQPGLKKVEDSIAALNSEIDASKFYAAGYFRLSEYLNRLFEAEQRRDVEASLPIRREMEETLDITALYTSGQLWESILNFYLSIFNQTLNDGVKQTEYAESVLKTSRRLGAPYFEAYIAGCITETERFGWMDARDSILAHVIEKNPGFKTNILSLQHSLNSFLMRYKGIAPEIAGLSASKDYTKTVLAFHDSDCNTCLNEMNTLARNYELLRKNKIRVVSVAADKNKERFEAETRNFPWADKLCDFQGFEGVNFTAFGVVATPTFFIISKDGKIEGELNDANELVSKLSGE